MLLLRASTRGWKLFCLLKVQASYDAGTWLAVDGEAIPRDRVFIEIHPGLCRVITA